MSSAAPTHERGEGVRARRPFVRRRRVLYSAALVVVVLALVAAILSIYTDWLWFGEVGLRSVFWARVWTGLVAGAAAAAVFLAVFIGDLALAARLAPRYRPVAGVDVVEAVHGTAQRWVRRAGLAVGVLGALIAGAAAAGAWLVFARALNVVPFGASDPVFHHDLGFYVFTVPAWHWA